MKQRKACPQCHASLRVRRAAIATLLMVGAIVVMGAVAVISSFTVNNKQTTSSRASGGCSGGYCRQSGTCGTIGFIDAGPAQCGTNLTCCKPPSTVPVPSNTPVPASSGGGVGCYSRAACTDICGGVNNCTLCSGSTTQYKCKDSISAITPSNAPTIVTPSPVPQTTTNAAYDCSQHGGGSPYPGTGCYGVCEGQGTGYAYVPNSQGPGSDGQNYCCCVAPAPTGANGQPNDSCCLLKCGATDGAPSSVVYSPSLSQYGMPTSSCNGWNKGYQGWLYLCANAANYTCSGGTLTEATPVVDNTSSDNGGTAGGQAGSQAGCYKLGDKQDCNPGDKLVGVDVCCPQSTGEQTGGGDAPVASPIPESENTCTTSNYINGKYNCDGKGNYQYLINNNGIYNCCTSNTCSTCHNTTNSVSPIPIDLVSGYKLLSCRSDICQTTEIGNGNIIYHDKTKDKYYKSDKTTELLYYSDRANYCGCASPTPTPAQGITDFFKQGSVFKYYNCREVKGDFAGKLPPAISCMSECTPNGEKCMMGWGFLYCCGSMTQ